MSAELEKRLAEAEATIRALTDELAETNRGMVALNEELEQRVEARTAELRASEELYRMLAENTSDMIVLRDATGRTLYRSPSCTRNLGWTDGEVAAGDWNTDGWRERVHPEDQRLIEQSQAASRRGEAHSLIFRYRKKDGSYVWLETRVQPVLDAQGKVFRRVLVGRDITERMKGESELRKSNAQLSFMNKHMVGRELRMIELKKEINQLCAEMKRPPQYPKWGDEKAP